MYGPSRRTLIVTSVIGPDCTLAVVAVSTISRRSLAALITLCGLLIAGLGALAVATLVTEDGGTGPVLVRVSDEHGLHLGDLPVLLIPLFGLGLMGVGRLLRRPSR